MDALYSTSSCWVPGDSGPYIFPTALSRYLRDNHHLSCLQARLDLRPVKDVVTFQAIPNQPFLPLEGLDADCQLHRMYIGLLGDHPCSSSSKRCLGAETPQRLLGHMDRPKYYHQGFRTHLTTLNLNKTSCGDSACRGTSEGHSTNCRVSAQDALIHRKSAEMTGFLSPVYEANLRRLEANTIRGDLTRLERNMRDRCCTHLYTR